MEIILPSLNPLYYVRKLNDNGQHSTNQMNNIRASLTRPYIIIIMKGGIPIDGEIIIGLHRKH